MTVSQLAERMAQWLRSEYQAVIFSDGATTVGYALFRRDVDHVYLRQFFIKPELRRRGFGREAIEWLGRHAWIGAPRVRLDVLIGNRVGLAFWKAVGFRDYCVTMEMDSPSSG